MKRKNIAWSLSIMMTCILIVGGCSKESPTDAITSDQEFFNSVVTGNDSNTSDLFTTDQEALNESDNLKSLPGVLKKGLGGNTIIPLKWGRMIESVTRTISKPVTMLGDTTAIVHASVTFVGNFVIQALSGTDTVVIKKPYRETIERNLSFERIAHTKRPRFNWRLDAVSVAYGGTENTSISIQSITLETPNQTFAVTDPNSYYMEIERFWFRRLPVVQNVPITLRVTVKSNSADSDLVTLHHLPGTFGLHNTPLTMISENNAGGVYTRVYEKTTTLNGSLKKYAHIMVSASTKASLYSDDATNFSTAVWGIPYKTSE